MSQAMQVTVEQVATDALCHAAQCIDELVDSGEPMGDRQTFRRGYNAADEIIVEAPISGDNFDECVDIVGDAVGMALEHSIAGKDAAEFYRNKADAIQSN